MLRRLYDAIRGWRTAKPKPEPSHDLIEPKPSVRFYDELVDAILGEWYSTYGLSKKLGGYTPIPFANFRLVNLSNARREANRIIALPPISNIVAEWSLERIRSDHHVG